MKVAVWKIGEWKDSKFDYGRNCRVVFKGLDDNKSYYLNMTEVFGVRDKWEHLCKLGNVLNVQVIEGTNNINKFSNVELIRKVKQNDSVERTV